MNRHWPWDWFQTVTRTVKSRKRLILRSHVRRKPMRDAIKMPASEWIGQESAPFETRMQKREWHPWRPTEPTSYKLCIHLSPVTHMQSDVVAVTKRPGENSAPVPSWYRRATYFYLHRKGIIGDFTFFHWLRLPLRRCTSLCPVCVASLRVRGGQSLGSRVVRHLHPSVSMVSTRGHISTESLQR